TVKDAWDLYRPVTERDNDSWKSDVGRANHLLRHLGTRRAASLTVEDVDKYRNDRLKETTKRKAAPRPATLDREIELLKRFLNYAVAAKRPPRNPIAERSRLNTPNGRPGVIPEELFAKLQTGAGRLFRALMLVAYDTGMRTREVLDLPVAYLDLKAGAIRLPAEATKTEKPRVIYLTKRTLG